MPLPEKTFHELLNEGVRTFDVNNSLFKQFRLRINNKMVPFIIEKLTILPNADTPERVPYELINRGD